MNTETLYQASYHLWGHELRCLASTKKKAMALLWKAYIQKHIEDVTVYGLSNEPKPKYKDIKDNIIPKSFWNTYVEINEYKLDQVYYGENLVLEGE